MAELKNKLQKVISIFNILALCVSFLAIGIILFLVYVIGGISSSVSQSNLDASFYLLFALLIVAVLLTMIDFGMSIALMVLAGNDENFISKKVGKGILVTNIILTILIIIADCFIISGFAGNVLCVIVLILSIIVFICYISVSVFNYLRLKHRKTKL